jgi:hypothetical protein
VPLPVFEAVMVNVSIAKLAVIARACVMGAVI